VGDGESLVLKSERRVSIRISLIFSLMILISSEMLVLRRWWRLDWSFERLISYEY
jgi:hypothetical protein